MIRKVLVFLREPVCYGCVDAFAIMLGKAMEKKGIEIEYIDISGFINEQPDESLLAGIGEKRFDAAIAFNAIGQQDYRLKGNNIWDMYGIPFYNYILDHPQDHDSDIRSGGKDYYIICVDRDHVDYIRKYYTNVKDAFYVGVPGFINGSYKEVTQEDYFNREIRILFTATYIPLASIEEKINRYPERVRELSVELIEHMLENRELTPEESLRMLLHDKGITQISNEEFYRFSRSTALAYGYVKAYEREELSRYLIASGLPITLCGSNWDELLQEEKADHVKLIKPVPYVETADLYRKSKLVLNHSPHFRRGIHDRIPTAMLNGSAVLTDGNDIMKTMFATGGDNRELYVYDNSKPWEVSPQINKLFSDQDAMFGTVVRAKHKAEQGMTWDAKAVEILDIMEAGSVRS